MRKELRAACAFEHASDSSLGAAWEEYIKKERSRGSGVSCEDKAEFEEEEDSCSSDGMCDE